MMKHGKQQWMRDGRGLSSAVLTVGSILAGLTWYLEPSGSTASRAIPVARPVLVYSADAADGIHLFTQGQDGHSSQITFGDTLEMLPEYSPDGSRIAFVQLDRFRHGYRLATVSSDGTDIQTLVSDLPVEITIFAPRLSWSPDGRYIALSTSSEGNNRLTFVEVATGRMLALPDTGPWTKVYAAAFSRDQRPDVSGYQGRLVLSARVRDGLAVELFVLPIEIARGGKPVVRMAEARCVTGALPGSKVEPDWSPDGRTLVFRNTWDNVCYRLDVQGQAKPQSVGQRLISARWLPDGRHIVGTAVVDFQEDGVANREIRLLDLATGRTTDRTHTPNRREGRIDWNPRETL